MVMMIIFFFLQNSQNVNSKWTNAELLLAVQGLISNFNLFYRNYTFLWLLLKGCEFKSKGHQKVVSSNPMVTQKL